MTAFSDINDAWNWLENKHKNDPEGRMAVARVRLGTAIRIKQIEPLKQFAQELSEKLRRLKSE